MDVADNQGTVMRIYEAWNGPGRLENALDLMCADVEWVNPDYAVEPGTRCGHAGMLDVQRTLDAAFNDYEHEPYELIGVGEDQVLALLKFRARGRDSGAHLVVDEQHLWTFRDGRAARLQWFHDVAEASAAAGVEAPR